MKPRAAWMQALDAQVELYAFLRSDVGRADFRDHARGLEKADLNDYYNSELYKILFGDPIFVAAEMCNLIETAATTFAPESMLASDVLTPTGFLYFEQPVEYLEGKPGDQVLMPYSVLTWTTVEVEEGIAYYGTPIGIDATLYTNNMSPLTSAKSPLMLWHSDSIGFEHEPRPDERFGIRPLVQTTLKLMAEFKPASRYDSRERPDRAARRRARRVGLPEREILVVRLRRKRTLTEKLSGSADYSCRFMVSGHWRNQWYPSAHKHRQVWISPYVKGPDDKPFRPPRHRAFNLDR